MAFSQLLGGVVRKGRWSGGSNGSLGVIIGVFSAIGE
jgi:hypothetical protein